MYKFLVVVLVGATGTLGAGQLEGEEVERSGKSLLNTFPFNANNQHHHGQHHHDHRHSGSVQPLDARQSSVARNQRQRSDEIERQDHFNFDVVAEATATAKPDYQGKRCVDKVEMVEVIEYDEEVQCDHSYDTRCHTTYITNYESQQEEECEENFRKNCFIDYEKIAFNETVEVCKTPLIKDCDQEGPQICRTVYESECWTKPEKHFVEDDVVSCETVEDVICKTKTSGYITEDECSKWPREVCTVTKKPVEKHTPVTGCHKEPRELCAPAGCKLVPARVPDCWDEVKTIVQDKPKEDCSLEPQRTCKHVTKLVPKLTPTEECVDVPKEVCSRSRTNPKPVKKPVIKKWCYVPSEESGLA